MSVAAVCEVSAQSAASATAGTYENLNSVLWVQTSAEYRASAVQTYRGAEVNLERALKDRTWTAAIEQTGPYADLPPAIIIDLDETVLDNSAFEARLTAAHASYTEAAWNEWVKQAKSSLVPGAAEFLSVAHAHGVEIFYLSNRICDAGNMEDATVTVLRSHHLPLGKDRLLCKSGEADKAARRALISHNFRVLLLIGDDLSDFVSLSKSENTVETRRAIQMAYERYWGDRWFMLPNPTYGSWELAVGFKVNEKLRRLRQ
jgi:acid phosphatase